METKHIYLEHIKRTFQNVHAIRDQGNELNHVQYKGLFNHLFDKCCLCPYTPYLDINLIKFVVPGFSSNLVTAHDL